ncbi:hypothetical protein CR513_61089, partial [Mucuna pruriens]
MVEFNKKKINELELDKKFKESLLNVLINSDLEDTFEGLYDEEENVVIYQLEISTFEDDQNSKEGYYSSLDLCNCLNCKLVNMLTRAQTFSLISIDEESGKGIQLLNMKEIYNKFKAQGEQVKIRDLQTDIKSLKQKI